MRLLVVTWLLLSIPAFGQELKLPDEVAIKYGRLKQITVKTDCKNIKWFVTPEMDIDVLPYSDGKSVIISIDPDSKIEEFQLRAISAKADIPLISNVCIIKRNTPPVPPVPPEPLDSFQSKLKSIYVEPDPPKYLLKMANFFEAASKAVMQPVWVDTLSMVKALKVTATEELGNNVMPLRLEVNAYLTSKFGNESLEFDLDLRKKWSTEFAYIANSLRKVAK